MKDAATKDERQFIATALAAYRTHQAEAVPAAGAVREPAKAENKGIGKRIRSLLIDGLDDKAIAAMTGASVGSVTATAHRLRKEFGLDLHRKDISKMGVLIDLPDDLRGLLMAEAAHAKVGVNTFVNSLLSEALRLGLTPSSAEQRGLGIELGGG